MFTTNSIPAKSLSIIKLDIIAILDKSSLSYPLDKLSSLREDYAGELYIIMRRLEFYGTLNQELVNFLFSLVPHYLERFNRIVGELELKNLLNSDIINLVKDHISHSIFDRDIDEFSEFMQIANPVEANQLMQHFHGNALIKLLVKLHQKKLLSKESTSLILSCQNLIISQNILIGLIQNNLLNELHIARLYNWNALFNSQDSKSLIDAFITILSNFGEVTQHHQDYLEKTQNPRGAANVLVLLQKKQLWQYEHLIFSSESSAIFDAVMSLDGHNLLTLDNLKLLLDHPQPHDLAEGFTHLNTEGLLNDEYIALVSQHSNPAGISTILCKLKRNKLLNPKNQATVISHKRVELIGAIHLLSAHSILTQNNFDIVSTNSRIMASTHAIIELHEHKILTDDIQKYLRVHPDPAKLASSLLHLHKCALLNTDTKSFVALQPNPMAINGVLYLLKYKKCLNANSLKTVMGWPSDKIDNFATILSQLNKKVVLNANTLEQLMQQQHAILLGDDAMEQFWSRIPPNQLNLALLERAFAVTTQTDTISALRKILHQSQNGANPKQQAEAVNSKQSTHTESVHQSSSESARNLFQMYQHHENLQNLNETLRRIQTFVNNLPDTHINSAAKRAINRLVIPNAFFKDRLSGISIHQLLALAYTAIHDDAKRSGSLKDALELFVNGLYEIQRGYNLNEAGQDDFEADKSICSAGTFNKVIEKLTGVHLSVSLIFTTNETAILKFKKLTENHAMTYLLKHRDQALLAQLDEDGDFSSMWPFIEAQVTAEFWDEFKLFFNENRKHKDYLSLLDCAPDLLVDQRFIENVQAQLNKLQSTVEETSELSQIPSIKQEPIESSLSLQELHAQQHVEFNNHHLMLANHTPNMTEYYVDAEVQMLLNIRLSAHPNTAVLATLDPTYPGQSIEDFVKDAILKNYNYQTQIIPIHFANHWMGISIRRNHQAQPLVTFYDSMPNPSRAQYFQSLLAAKIEATLQQTIQWQIKPNTMVQEDGTSCGAYLIENIVSDLLGHQPEAPSTNVTIRQFHLALLAQYHPDIYAQQFAKASNNNSDVQIMSQFGLFSSSNTDVSSSASDSKFTP